MPIYNGNTKNSIWRRWVYNRALAPFAEIKAVDNSTETTISTQNVAVQVTIFDTNGESYNTTPDHTNDHITVDQAGKYLILVSASIDSIAALPVGLDPQGPQAPQHHLALLQHWQTSRQ